MTNGLPFSNYCREIKSQSGSLKQKIGQVYTHLAKKDTVSYLLLLKRKKKYFLAIWTKTKAKDQCFLKHIFGWIFNKFDKTYGVPKMSVEDLAERAKFKEACNDTWPKVREVITACEALNIEI